jgi:hypothetical protein
MDTAVSAEDMAQLETELAAAIQISAKYENRYFETLAELAAMTSIAEKWEADALRYAKNAEYWQARAEKAEAELAAAKKRIADCEFVMAHRYDIIERQEPRCNEANARAEKAEAELARAHDIIKRASVQFFHDGTDGDAAAKMLTVLNEAAMKEASK